MHKKVNRNILSRKKKADFENYGSFSHVKDLADTISAYCKVQRDSGKFSYNRRVQVCHGYLQVAVLIRRVNGKFQLMTAIEPVPMQEETGADEIFPGFVTYVTKYEPPRKIGRMTSGGLRKD